MAAGGGSACCRRWVRLGFVSTVERAGGESMDALLQLLSTMWGSFLCLYVGTNENKYCFEAKRINIWMAVVGICLFVHQEVNLVFSFGVNSKKIPH